MVSIEVLCLPEAEKKNTEPNYIVYDLLHCGQNRLPTQIRKNKLKSKSFMDSCWLDLSGSGFILIIDLMFTVLLQNFMVSRFNSFEYV